LHNAAGLAPDNPRTWLELAQMMRWLGEYRNAVADLELARSTVGFAPGGESLGLRYDIALTHAWLHYDRGEWRRGLAWADSAAAISPDDELTLQIQGLLLAGAGQFRYAQDCAHQLVRYDTFSNDARWIFGMSEWYRGLYTEARAYFSGQEGDIKTARPKDGEMAPLTSAIRPEEAHRSECWRDMATLEELLENYPEAARRYDLAAGSLPCGDATCLKRTEYRLLRPTARDHYMPVWLAFERFCVTGSHSAYAALAVDRFASAQTTTDRHFWAEQAIEATGICIRKELDKPYALRERGIVFVETGKHNLARSDLRRAQRLFEARRYDDFRTLAWLGHLNLKESVFEAALPQLEKAVTLNASTARVWSDLGLARARTGDATGARAALDRAISLDPELAVAWHNRGMLSYYEERWADAITDLENAAQLAPGNQETIAALQRAKLALRQETPSDQP
jgi:tetratricopeptide (TPR) repeat protein